MLRGAGSGAISIGGCCSVMGGSVVVAVPRHYRSPLIRSQLVMQDRHMGEPFPPVAALVVGQTHGAGAVIGAAMSENGQTAPLIALILRP